MMVAGVARARDALRQAAIECDDPATAEHPRVGAPCCAAALPELREVEAFLDDLDTLSTDRWMEALQEAWMLAVGERGNELRGRRVRRFDAQGMHPFSAAFGRAALLADLLEIPAEALCSSVEMRREARRQAEDDFAVEVAERGAQVFRDAERAERQR